MAKGLEAQYAMMGDEVAWGRSTCVQTLGVQSFFFLGNGPNTVSESTVSNTELSEFFWGSLSSGERAQ